MSVDGPASYPPMAFSHDSNRELMHQAKNTGVLPFFQVSSRPAVLLVTALLHFTDGKKSSGNVINRYSPLQGRHSYS